MAYCFSSGGRPLGASLKPNFKSLRDSTDPTVYHFTPYSAGAGEWPRWALAGGPRS